MINLDQTILIQIGIVLFLLIVLNKIFFKPMLKLINERKDRVENTNLEKEDKKKETYDLSVKYEDSLNSAREKAVMDKEEIRSEGIQREKEIIEKVNQEYEDAIKEATAKAKKELEEAEKELDKYVKTLSVQLAEKILQRRI